MDFLVTSKKNFIFFTTLPFYPFLKLGPTLTHCLKITQNVAFEFWHFPPIFDLSGNTVRPQASGFQKLAKMNLAFFINFCQLKM